MKTSKCQKFGELVFDVGDKYDKNDRDLIIELEMGGTFISANIRYKNEYDIKKLEEKYEKELKVKDEKIFELNKRVSFLLKKLKYMENKIYTNSFNNEDKIFSQSTIQQNNEIINNKTSRGYSTANIFRKKEKNKNNNLNIIPNSRAKKKKFLNK